MPNRFLGWLSTNDGLAGWVEVVIIAVTAGVAFFQLGQISQGLKSQASASVFNQQLEINKLFSQDGNEDLFPYFFAGEEVPKSNKKLQTQANMVAGSILDFFSHAEDQSEAGVFEIDKGWTTYIKRSFELSPKLCEVLEENRAYYSDFLWTVSREPCGQG
jgi:hypothetical protein